MRAAHSIERPVDVTAAQVRVHTAGRGGTYATVTYITDHGFEQVRLPQLGHDEDSYRAPVRLVYDAAHPSRAVLAADWRYGNSRRTSVSFWVALGVFVATAGWLAWKLISLIRLLRSARNR